MEISDLVGSSAAGQKKFIRVRKGNPALNKSNTNNNVPTAVEGKHKAAKMAAAKKKQAEIMSFQIEVDNEVQWRSLLRREGMIVVDVYPGWAGPCTSMISILKRIKAEVNDDRLWMAIANSDNITDLLMFKDQSEPTWLFIGGGKPIKVVRSAHVPKLIGAIRSEFEHELLVMAGKAKRNLISIDDEVTRRKKAESEASRLAQFVKEEDDTAKGLNKLRTASSTRLMSSTEVYTVLVVQSYLLDTGAVTEIRDSLQGEFKIEQERILHINEKDARHLFRIPFTIPDPNEPTEDFGYNEPDPLPETMELKIRDPDEQSTIGEESPENDVPQLTIKQGKRKMKMIPVHLPEGLVGETLFMLLESVEMRKMIGAGKTPDSKSALQNADDYIQVKTGPVDYQDALEHAPYSFHALYGKEKYVAGVWCPRRYDDKRYVMLNFFPRFVTELLIPPTKAGPKYTLAVFPAAQAADVSREVNFQKKDVIAEGKVKLKPELAEEMLRSTVRTQDQEERMKALTKGEVYAISVNRKNSALMLALRSLDPLHVSYDGGYGKIETSKVFTSLNIKTDDIPDPDAIVEKFLARSVPRVISKVEISERDLAKKSKKKSTISSASVRASDDDESRAQSMMSVQSVAPKTSRAKSKNIENPEVSPSTFSTQGEATKPEVSPSTFSTKPEASPSSFSASKKSTKPEVSPSTFSTKPEISPSTFSTAKKSTKPEVSPSTFSTKPEISPSTFSTAKKSTKPEVSPSTFSTKPEISPSTFSTAGGAKPSTDGGASPKLGMSPSQASVKPGASPSMASVKPGVSPSQAGVKPGVSPSMASVKPDVSPSMASVKPGVSPSQASVKPGVSPSMASVKPGVSPSMASVKPGVSPSQASVKPGVSPSQASVKPGVSPSHASVRPSDPKPGVSPSQASVKPPE